MANEIAEKKESFSVALTNSLNEVSDALPSDFNKVRFVQNAVALLNDNEQLSKFAKEHGTSQIKAGLMKGAYLGLDFFNKEAHLVPFGSQLTFMVDYRGQEKLVRKYAQRPVKDVYAKIVREGDEFDEYILDGKPSVTYRAKPFNNAPIIGAFAVCLFEDGGLLYDTMSLEELENTRSSSRAKNSPAWTKFTSEMYKKTVLHRLCKHIGLDFDNVNQSDAFYEDSKIGTDAKEVAMADIESSANSVDFVDAEAVEVSE